MSSSSQSSVEYFVKTDEAHTVKATIEVLQNNFTDVCFEFSDAGINLITVDKKVPYTKLAILDWPRSNFDESKYVKSRNVGVNLQHFYKLLSSLKKKDCLSLELNKNLPGKLSIDKFVNGTGEPSNSELQIQRRQLIHVDKFDGYGYPILITTAQFQRAVKEINKLSKVLTVTSQGGFLNFSCDVDGMYRHNSPFSKKDPDCKDEEYEDQFNTKDLMGLIKLNSLNSKMHVSTAPGKPLWIRVKTGDLGIVDFYIRSREQIGEE